MSQATFAVEYDPSNKINQLALTMALLKHNYISNMDDNVIAEKAIRGLLNQLDPHSDYLDINELASLEDTTSGKVTGIGVEVTIEHGHIKVIAPVDNSPAKRAGIKNGDFITHVNDTLVVDVGFLEAISKIKGPSGTPVKITILRPGEKQPLHFTIVREEIKAASVTAEMIDAQTGYLRIGYFGDRTPKETRSALNKLIKKNRKMSGLVIDLRNNPGGVLQSAVEVTDLFLDKESIGHNKIITTAKERGDKITQSYTSQTGDMTDNLPIAITINSGSASGAEIMAGALKDHNRATLIGEPSFGKGSIQTVMPLSESTAIKITTGLYYTPAGHVVQKKGIEPDISSPNLAPAQSSALDIRESDYFTSTASPKTQSATKRDADKKIIQKYGIEVYQAMQSLSKQQREATCQ